MGAVRQHERFLKAFMALESLPQLTGARQKLDVSQQTSTWFLEVECRLLMKMNCSWLRIRRQRCSRRRWNRWRGRSQMSAVQSFRHPVVTTLGRSAQPSIY